MQQSKVTSPHGKALAGSSPCKVHGETKRCAKGQEPETANGMVMCNVWAPFSAQRDGFFLGAYKENQTNQNWNLI